MAEIIIGLILLFGGGVAGNQLGKSKEAKKAAAKQELIIGDLHAANVKLDSLARLPAKVDTIKTVTTRTEVKVDTLVLLNSKVLRNTELLLKDTKEIKDSIKSLKDGR